jgi:hypothetical protein
MSTSGNPASGSLTPNEVAEMRRMSCNEQAALTTWTIPQLRRFLAADQYTRNLLLGFGELPFHSTPVTRQTHFQLLTDQTLQEQVRST